MGPNDLKISARYLNALLDLLTGSRSTGTGTGRSTCTSGLGKSRDRRAW